LIIASIKNNYIFVIINKFFISCQKLFYIVALDFNKTKKISIEIIYLFLIAFFCYTASNKIMNLNSFRTNLLKTSIFSEENANLFSVLVIVLEFIVVLVLFFNKKIGFLVFSITISIFTFYISYLKHNGLYEVCGCGGILNGLSYYNHLSINVMLIITSFFSYYTINTLQIEK
jgi:hypothetical protein